MIVVPSTTKITQTLTDQIVEEYVERTMRFLAERFGGASAFRAEGSWLSASGMLINENVTYVLAFTKSLSEAEREDILHFGEQMRDELDQEAVAIIINGVLYLI